ncbi:GntR family transcriptional regulator [Streptomyces sp. NPDC046275]|uniref:GntR family transcriptional regulator n=1 Tax=Streptomyces sp. NPDC046275 TaxID=3157201 RepID=UPI003404D96F
MSTSTPPHRTAAGPSRANDDDFARRRTVLLHLLREHLAQYAVGAPLPWSGQLADWLGQETHHISAALVQLDQMGEVVYGGRHRVARRLGPNEQHPDDVALDQAVRAAIASGAYRPGDPLPTAILASRHGLDLTKVPRAFRRLIKDKLVAHRDGPAGPGYYVLPQPGS